MVSGRANDFLDVLPMQVNFPKSHEYSRVVHKRTVILFASIFQARLGLNPLVQWVHFRVYKI